MFKINYNQKKQKEREEELKKFFELYKLQENIFNNSCGNNFNDTYNSPPPTPCAGFSTPPAPVLLFR